MTPLHATIRLLRDVRCSASIPADTRNRWSRRLAVMAAGRLGIPTGGLRARFSPRVRVGAGGRMLRAVISGGEHPVAVRLKWCPDADPAALEATAQNMRWWRAHHPQLCTPVAELLDYWPDDRVLVIAERGGARLGEGNADALAASRLARWIREYAQGNGTYDEDVKPLLLATVNRTATGSLRVDARPLLEARIASAERSAVELRRSGFAIGQDWKKRFDVDALLRTHTAPQPAGFVHGDFKPGNVLVAGSDFTIVDWWIAPCISWPLTDVAHFAGSLWLDDSATSRSLWDCFFAAYFTAGIDEVTRRTIDLIATSMCLGFLAGRARRFGGRIIEQRRIDARLHRLVDPATCIGVSARASACGVAPRSVPEATAS